MHSRAGLGTAALSAFLLRRLLQDARLHAPHPCDEEVVQDLAVAHTQPTQPDDCACILELRCSSFLLLEKIQIILCSSSHAAHPWW